MKTALIWYKFGLSARTMLERIQQLDLDNLDIRELIQIQNKCEELNCTLQDELDEHLRLNPD